MNLDKIFHLKENNTNVKTEILAGVTTFMTMAYILAVNPIFWQRQEWITERSLQRQLWQRSSVRYVWQSLQTIRLHWRREWD